MENDLYTPVYTRTRYNASMDAYEKKLQTAADRQIPIYEEWDMGNDPEHETLDGLYVDGSIALSADLKTRAEKTCVLAEELAHHELTVGDILSAQDAASRRQEQKARTYAYNDLIGLSRLVSGFEHGCRSRYEFAEYLDVTESFLQAAIDRYREIYGRYKEIDGYIVYFDPPGIMKI